MKQKFLLELFPDFKLKVNEHVNKSASIVEEISGFIILYIRNGVKPAVFKGAVKERKELIESRVAMSTMLNNQGIVASKKISQDYVGIDDKKVALNPAFLTSKQTNNNLHIIISLVKDPIKLRNFMMCSGFYKLDVAEIHDLIKLDSKQYIQYGYSYYEFDTAKPVLDDSMRQKITAKRKLAGLL